MKKYLLLSRKVIYLKLKLYQKILVVLSQKLSVKYLKLKQRKYSRKCWRKSIRTKCCRKCFWKYFWNLDRSWGTRITKYFNSRIWDDFRILNWNLARRTIRDSNRNFIGDSNGRTSHGFQYWRELKCRIAYSRRSRIETIITWSWFWREIIYKWGNRWRNRSYLGRQWNNFCKWWFI